MKKWLFKIFIGKVFNQMKTFKIRIIAVDYDGTLTLGDSYPLAGQLNMVAIKILKEFKQNGGKIILFTCREGEPLLRAVNLCKEAGLEFDAVNENIEGQFEAFQLRYPDAVENRKPYADLYIDDKAWPWVADAKVDWHTIGKIIL